MVRLKLHGPRRPGSSRGESMASAAAGGATPEDTIRVARPASAASPSADGRAATPASPMSSRGVASSENAQVDTDITEADDVVEEYDFSKEPEDVEEEDDGRDTAYYKNATGAITIDSDNDQDQSDTMWQATYRPWRDPDFTIENRKVRETMFSHQTEVMPWNDPRVSEAYQNELDKEMLRYIEDFPLENWAIGSKKAQAAMDKLNERTRWRKLGIPVLSNINTVFSSSQQYQAASTHPVAGPGPSVYGAAGPVNPASYGIPPHSQNMGHYPAGPYAHPQVPYGASGYPPQHGLPSHPYPHQPQIQTQPIAYGQMGAPAMPRTQHGMGLPPNQSRLTSPGKSKGKEAMRDTQDAPAVDGKQIPPYPLRKKPAERESSRYPMGRTARRHAQADVFPWNRDIDFQALKANVKWDDSMYDGETLADNAQTRNKNGATIRKAESSTAQATKPSSDPASESEAEAETSPAKKGAKSRAVESSGLKKADYYSFASDEDLRKGKKLGANTPDELVDLFNARKVSLEACAGIKIHWNPAKSGITQSLDQIHFSVKDHIVTVQQLETMLIFNRQAAERIIDFCPNLLWREILLRIASETGLGNKGIRERMCLNGNYIDMSSIAKRIGSALGSKQAQSVGKPNKKKQVTEEPTDLETDLKKLTGYAAGEKEYYEANKVDFNAYGTFFGFRTHQRGPNTRGSKRKVQSSDNVEMGGTTAGPSKKRAKTEEVTSPETISEETPGSDPENDEMSGVEEDEEEANEGDKNDDAVSVQSDTVLDGIED